MANIDLAREIVAAVVPQGIAPPLPNREEMLVDALSRLDLEGFRESIAEADRLAVISRVREGLTATNYWYSEGVSVEDALADAGRKIATDQQISREVREIIERDCLYCGYTTVTMR